MDENFGTVHEWQVDLKREEQEKYLRLLTHMPGIAGTKIPGMVIALLTTTLILLSILWEYLTFGEWDIPMLILGILIIILDINRFIVMPQRNIRIGMRAFDEGVRSGRAYYGTYRILPDRIEKDGEIGKVSFPLDPSTLFIETADMMVWINNRQPPIILPARCVSDEMARITRQAADRLPDKNRRFIARIRPGNQPVIRQTVTPVEPLFRQLMQTTDKEYVAMMRRSMRYAEQRIIVPMVLVVSIVSIVAGFMAGGQGGWLTAIIVFVLISLIVGILRFLLPHLRLRQLERDGIEPEKRTFTVCIYPDRIECKGKQMMMAFSWHMIDHIIDRGELIELQVSRASFSFPKRCIEDMEAFEQNINRFWNNKK